MDAETLDAYVGAALGVAVAASSIMGVDWGLPGALWPLGAVMGLALLAISPLVWLGSRRALAGYVVLAALSLLVAVAGLVRPGAAGVLVAVLSALCLALTARAAAKKRGGGVHPLDLPVYG